MPMEQSIVEREKRRRLLEKRKRKRRKRVIQRIVIVLAGLLGLIIMIRGCVGLVRSYNKDEQVVSPVEQDEAQKDLSDSGQVIESNEGKLTVTREDLAKGNLILVNDENPIRYYDESELVSIAENNEGAYQVKDKSVKLNKEAMIALNKMLMDFKEAKGENELIIVSGYRDFNAQEKIHYETIVNEGMEQANNYVAKPDRSEHHTGFAIDLGIYHADGTSSEYDGTGIYSWINDNCYKYGFILRYESEKKDKTGISKEPWHFRYVGKVHAEIMHELNLCLEEYILYLKNYSYYTNPGQGIVEAGKNYSIYYVPAENDMTYIPIPENKDYTVSGNNKDGFIVTVALNKENNVNNSRQ